MTWAVDDATRQRWAREREEDARALMRIRDTLALIDRDDFPPLSKARCAAREAEGVVTSIESEFDRQACYCPKCEEGDIEYRFSDHWSIRCRCCGWTVTG